ncbi:hypothetical protein FRB99_008638 [Tulasnella sp. 403]|nr:hypothetical protein FRB99_008638 [Tulasnella sp. 403]
MSGIQLAPSPWSNRFLPPTLIPLFYTSNLFVDALREDVRDLLTAFEDRFAAGPDGTKPFPLFRSIWAEKDWNWLHLKCSEPHSRIDFLKTVFRVFIENIDSTKSASVQVAALFALYTFHGTQPPASTGFYSLKKIPIAIDTYTYMLSLPNSVPETLSKHVLCILNTMVSESSFAILPESSLHPYSTRDLPNARVVPYDYLQKTGRPSKPQVIVRTRAAVNRLDNWVDAMDRRMEQDSTVPPEAADATHYPSTPDASSSLVAGSSAAHSQSTETFPPSHHLREQRGTKRKAVGEGSAPVGLTLPDVSDYVAVKERLKALLPTNVLHAAENETRETMYGVEQYANERGIVPDTGWKGLQRMQEHRSMLDFVKVDQTSRLSVEQAPQTGTGEPDPRTPQ